MDWWRHSSFIFKHTLYDRPRYSEILEKVGQVRGQEPRGLQMSSLLFAAITGMTKSTMSSKTAQRRLEHKCVYFVESSQQTRKESRRMIQLHYTNVAPLVLSDL